MAGLHAAQAGLILYLSTSFKLPVSVAYLTFSSSTRSLVPASKNLFSIPLVWLVVSFLLISAIAHLSLATFCNSWYNRNLKKGINKARWYEYSASASIMMAAIAMLVGIYDLASLVMIFALVAGMNLMGLVMEIHNQTTTKTNWTSYIIGSFLGIIPWIVVGIYFWAANAFGAGQIPSFVYWIYVSIFVFFNCFAINMFLQYKKWGPWKNYLFGERVYIILSLVAKSALAWQVFAGTLRP